MLKLSDRRGNSVSQAWSAVGGQGQSPYTRGDVDPSEGIMGHSASPQSTYNFNILTIYFTESRGVVHRVCHWCERWLCSILDRYGHDRLGGHPRYPQRTLWDESNPRFDIHQKDSAGLLDL